MEPEGFGGGLRGLRGSLGVFVTLAGVTCAMTLVFMAMRAVMEIGGRCGQGGPYVISKPCPKGIPLVILGGIWGGLIFAGLYVWRAAKSGIPSFVGLLWPALFLSLGWNSLQYGVSHLRALPTQSIPPRTSWPRWNGWTSPSSNREGQRDRR
jgi:hypothetical protein